MLHQEAVLLGLNEFDSNPLRLCSDLDDLGHPGELLSPVLCPLSPGGEDHHHLLSPLSGDSLSSPSLGDSLHGFSDGLHDATSCFDGQLQHSMQPGESVACSQFLPSCSSDEHASETCCPSSCSDDASNNRTQKRPKLEWTPELHAVFVEAVESLPSDKQVPSRILERMGHWGLGLTRANVASHLQKYRNRKPSAKPAAHAPDFSAVAAAAGYSQLPCAPLAPGVVLGVPCLPLMPAPYPLPAWPATASPVLPAEAAAAAAAAATTQPCQPAPQLSMIPTAAAAPCGVIVNEWWPLESPPAEEVPEELTRALRDVLAGKRKRGPLGLQLDCGAVQQLWNGSVGAPVFL